MSAVARMETSFTSTLVPHALVINPPDHVRTTAQRNGFPRKCLQRVSQIPVDALLDSCSSSQTKRPIGFVLAGRMTASMLDTMYDGRDSFEI